MKKTLLVLAALTIFLTGCDSGKTPDLFDYGTVEDDIYRNDYFGFTIDLPADWVVQSREQVEEITELGKDLIVGDDEKMKAVFEASEIKVANLLGVFQYELGAAVEFNPNLLVIAENLASNPGVKTGADYLWHVKRVLEQGQFRYDYISDNFEKEMIDGVEFYRIETGLSYADIVIRQYLYCAIRDGFSLSFTISYSDDEQKQTLLDVIHSIKFEN